MSYDPVWPVSLTGNPTDFSACHCDRLPCPLPCLPRPVHNCARDIPPGLLPFEEGEPGFNLSPSLLSGRQAAEGRAGLSAGGLPLSPSSLVPCPPRCSAEQCLCKPIRAQLFLQHIWRRHGYPSRPWLITAALDEGRTCLAPFGMGLC